MRAIAPKKEPEKPVELVDLENLASGSLHAENRGKRKVPPTETADHHRQLRSVSSGLRPFDGREFTPGEAYAILSGTQGKERSELIDFWIEKRHGPKSHRENGHQPQCEKGIVENGMLDRVQQLTPDLDEILRTLGRDVTTEEYKLLLDSYPKLHKSMEEHGYIPEQLFDDLKFPQDFDIFNEERVLQATIACENQQRCKILSHKEQCALRRNHANELEERAQSKILLVEAKKAAILEDNRKCEEGVCQSTGSIEDATLRAFSQQSKALLQASVHVRSTAEVAYPRELPKNKGKLGEAGNGVDNLILRSP